MSLPRPRARSVSALAVGALIAGGVALSAPAGAADRDVQPRSASYVYGNWAQPGTGLTTGSDDTLSQVYQLVGRSMYPDLAGTPGPIYAAGTFVKAGSTTINRVGQWNGTTWTTLPGDDTGIAGGISQSLAMNGSNSLGFASPGVFGMVMGGDDSLYAGGQFWGSDDSLNNVGQWQGNNWVRMGNGLHITTPGNVIQDMVIGNDFIGMDDTNYADDTVYAVGGFAGTCASLACNSTGRTAKGIAQYSQSDDTWYPMGAGTLLGGSDPQVYSGAYIDDTLYIGGQFDVVGGVNAMLVAQWRESTDTWLPLGAGLGNIGNAVYAMAVHPITKDLYVGGTFGQPVGATAGSTPGIIKWDYTDDTWYPVGTGLTSGNVDDISFSADGRTMYMGMWNGLIGGTSANFVASLTSEDLASPAATTVSGAWSYIKSAGVIGVTGPANSSINQRAVRAAYALPGDSVMFGGNFHSAGAVSAGRVATFTPGPEPSPYDPVYPAGVPTDVVANGGWNKVTVNWKAPTYTGSYPITYYLVTATPGGRSCLSKFTDTNFTECTYTSLTPGIRYTFTVQALNGAGWGEESASSNVASPQNLKIRSYSRKKLNFFLGGGSEVTAGGIAPGYSAGTRIIPWVKVGDREWESAATSSLAVNSSGNFTWKRKFNKKQNSTPMMLRFEIGGNFSNTVRIPGVR